MSWSVEAPRSEGVTAIPSPEVDRLPVNLLARVVRGTVLALGLAAVGAVPFGPRALGGLALGAAVGLGSLALHRALVEAWVRPLRWRRARVGFWLVWLAKYPVLGLILWVALGRGWAAPGWFCLGVSLLPGVATAIAVRAVVVDRWRARAMAGGSR